MLRMFNGHFGHTEYTPIILLPLEKFRALLQPLKKTQLGLQSSMSRLSQGCKLELAKTRSSCRTLTRKKIFFELKLELK